MSSNRSNKGTALITGASSGIGDALAREFASHGFDLIITARREAQLRQLASELEPMVNVQVVPCDLAKSDAVKQFLETIDIASIDVLVNNAGVSYSGSFQARGFDDIEDLLSLNILALTKLTHTILPAMIEKGAGRILNVASVGAFQALPSMSVYAASKAYVLSLSESLSEEIKGTGVSITALCPGITRTDSTLALQGSIPPFLISAPEDVAKEGYRGLMEREVIVIPGLPNQAAVEWSKHQPRWLVRGIGGLLAKFKQGI